MAVSARLPCFVPCRAVDGALIPRLVGLLLLLHHHALQIIDTIIVKRVHQLNCGVITFNSPILQYLIEDMSNLQSSAIDSVTPHSILPFFNQDMHPNHAQHPIPCPTSSDSFTHNITDTPKHTKRYRHPSPFTEPNPTVPRVPALSQNKPFSQLNSNQGNKTANL